MKGTEQIRAGAETECVLVCVCEREAERERASYKTDFGLQPAQSETAVQNEDLLLREAHNILTNATRLIPSPGKQIFNQNKPGW